MADETNKKHPIDKEFLIASLKNFDNEILSKKYGQKSLNQSVLDKLSEAEDGTLLFNGNSISFGEKGDPGKDGITPHIGDNGNWFIGTEDTGMKVEGEDGEDGITPHIGDNGNWYIGDYDTNVKVNGSDGEDGFTPTITEDSSNTDNEYRLKIINQDGEIIAPNLKGAQGVQGIPGQQGKPGNDGQQGLQGIKGDKGDDGYPFLIYKEYTDLSEFSASDFPEIGLLFMIKVENTTSSPVYRYTGETENPYSFVTNLSDSEGIKGDKGDPGQNGEQGIPGKDGADGTTYTPNIGTITSLSSNQSATATIDIDETEKIAAFNFGIPKGKDGVDGFTPTITENKSNKEDYYRLDITNEDKVFTTPNLMGVIGMEYKNKSVGTPVGEIISYMGTIAPPNYLICDGTVYQIEDYPYLVQHILDNFDSVNYFGGDGTSTFAVPDLRGEFLRGAGTATRNSGSGANVGAHQEPTIHLRVYANSSGAPQIYIKSDGERNIDKAVGVGSNLTAHKPSSITSASSNTQYSRFTSRPTNTSILYCIKYQPTYWITPTNATN